MEIFITKYALTKGILRKSAKVCTNISDNMVEITDNASCGGEYYHWKEWHIGLHF